MCCGLVDRGSKVGEVVVLSVGGTPTWRTFTNTKKPIHVAALLTKKGSANKRITTVAIVKKRQCARQNLNARAC